MSTSVMDWGTKKELGIPYRKCPYCGHKLTRFADGVRYCEDCDITFTDDDLEKEELRDSISASLGFSNEENPVECYISLNPYDEVGGPLLIDKMFENCNGEQFAHFYGTPNDKWNNMAEFTNDALREISYYFLIRLAN